MTGSPALAGAKVLVTGPSGFLGSHCLRRLASEPCEIHAVNRAGRGEVMGPRIHWHAADLRDAAQAAALVQRLKPTHLLHGAWIATPKVYTQSPENLVWLEAGTALLRAFGAAGGARFVGVGSSAEYAATDAPCLEDETPISPASIYGECKASLWRAAQTMGTQYGFAAAWGRVFLLYGPGDKPERLIPSVMAGLAAGRRVDTSDGRQVRDFIYAPDAADCLVQLLAAAISGAFNVGTGRGTAVRDVVTSLADRLHARERLNLGAYAASPSEPAILVADPTKVRTSLRWTPATTLEAGLESILITGPAKGND